MNAMIGPYTQRVNYRLVLLTLAITLLPAIALFAQTGPGGVGTSATNPLWLDAHTMGGVNGAAISSFTDYSGNNIHAVQPLVAKQPTFVTGAVNGKAALNFNGTQNLTTPATSTMDNILYFEWYIVSEIDNFNITSCPLNVDYGTIAAQDLFAGFLTQTSLPASSYSHNNVPQLKKANFPTTSGYNMYQGIYNRTAHTVSAHTNFVQNSVNISNYYNTVIHQGFDIGGKNTSYRIDGKIAEVFIFNFAMNTAQQKIMQNYIGAKYGIAIPTDLYAFQATHDLGVIGIGRDNATNLHSDSEGNGVIRINAPSAMGDGEYLFAGHNDVALTTLTGTDLPVSLPGYARSSRTWMVDETGDVGTITLTFDLSGGNDFGVSSTYRLLVDNVIQDGNFSDATELTGVYDGGLQTLTFTLDLNDGDYFTIAAGPAEIHAIATGNWSDPATWDCNCVPNSVLNNVYIDANVSVTLDMDASVNYFSCGDPAGTLICSADQNLTIIGDWDLLGAVNLTAGRIIMGGTADQYIDAGGNTVDFNDLEINNSGGGVTFFESQYILNGVLYPTQGSMTIDPTPANAFIINSTSAASTARIDQAGSGFTFDGTFTVRRFLPGGNADYRDIASSVNGADLSMWDASIFMSGEGFPDGCAYGTGCFYSVLYYENDVAVEVTDPNEPLVTGRGYEVFIGDDLTTFGGATLEVTGTLNDGQDVVLTALANYSTLGNPYASPISWENISLSGVGDFFYVYDNTTGFYEYYDGSDGSSSIAELASGTIAMGQAFWVYGPGTLTISESSKATSGTFVKNTAVNHSLSLNLRENSSIYGCSINLIESDGFEDGMDVMTDIPHLSSGFEKAPTLAMYTDAEKVRKNYIKNDMRNKSFDLYTKILNPGYYTIEASNIQNFNNYHMVLLYDHATNTVVNLKNEPAYTFYSAPTEGHRFTLILTNDDQTQPESIQSLGTGAELESGITITQMGHNFNIETGMEYGENTQVKLVNLLGQEEVFYQNLKLVEGSNVITIPAEHKGVFILVVTTGEKVITKKVVL
jgi:hypothetical protein